MAVSAGQDEDLMSSINITPLTDVLLVLLIIFMITAAAIQKERITIPITKYKDKANETSIIISIPKDGKIYVGATEVKPNDLEGYLENLAKSMPLDPDTQKPTDKVIIKADKDTPYGPVATAMYSARAADLNNISLATKPLDIAQQEKLDDQKRNAGGK